MIDTNTWRRPGEVSWGVSMPTRGGTRCSTRLHYVSLHPHHVSHRKSLSHGVWHALPPASPSAGVPGSCRYLGQDSVQANELLSPHPASLKPLVLSIT